MLGSLAALDPVGTALGALSDFAGAFGDIFSGIAFFTGEDFAAALAKGFMK
ncbi:hypothetical protein [Rhodococcus sp. IEGM 1408]|uniref:hypothetical protein n=1 Tax=Rhodococcus sp. IEGM 1408 TaxID=3082220 RepID=UPI00295528C6|nr:hypothetical protein [Rhodococcus sp. IEGM 1408]MDV8001597.1 hypothetical protein [Rhodococcus sp. IEGM 1408]